MNDQRFYSLKELKDAADKVCLRSGLYCFQARQWLDENGRKGYSVSIQGAAPDDNEVQEFMSRRLLDLGFKDIDVVTEW